MKFALLAFVAGFLGVGLVAASIWLYVKFPVSPAMELVPEGAEPEGDVEWHEDESAAMDALEQIKAASWQHPEFAEVWEKSVRGAADQMTALIAGQHMAGKTSGMVEWHADVPRPDDMPYEIAHLAFSYAVRTEVSRRVQAMTGPGAFG